MITRINVLKNFRNQFYSLCQKRKDAVMNLVDSLSSSGHKSKSVVELSEAPCFERQYASITDAITDGLPTVDWNGVLKITFEVSRESESKITPCFIVDCTGNPRPFSKKLSDKTINHAPNPAPGNKPIAVGHHYSCVAILPTDQAAREKNWIVPLAMERVASHQKGNEVGMQRIHDSIKHLGLQNDLSVSVGDSLYGSEACRIIAGKIPNQVHLFRLNSKRNLYFLPKQEASADKAKRGRKKQYGDKISLTDLAEKEVLCEKEEVIWPTAKGKTYRVIIKLWKDLLVRGTRHFKASQHPMNIVQITVVDPNDRPVFKRPLWVAAYGKRRHEVNLKEIHSFYSSRYDIEHFFRFGKNKLLMAAYQTPDTAHEENWWRVVAVAYNQLFLSRSVVNALPKPWERYLPEYKNCNTVSASTSSPSIVQRAFSCVLKEVGTPALHCKPRGKAPGRSKGSPGLIREDNNVIFKGKKENKSKRKSIISISEKKCFCSDPKKINDLLKIVQETLQKLNYSPQKFSETLLDTC